MLPSNEVPAIAGLVANAPVLVTLDVTRSSSGNITSGAVMFDTSYPFPGDVTFTGFHIHTGRAGENGPVIITSCASGVVVIQHRRDAAALVRVRQLCPHLSTWVH